MEPQQQSFDTLGRWMLTRLRADLASNPPAPAASLSGFLADLYDDMLENPGEYGIPAEPFVSFIARQTHNDQEKALHEQLKAARMRVRKAVFGYLEFLFELGKQGAAEGEGLQIARTAFDALVAAAHKKIKSQRLLSALARSGWSFSGGDPVVVTDGRHPGAPAALVALSQACAQVKDFDFYLFRRGDWAVMDGKKAPDITDALRLVPPPFQEMVAATDERLSGQRFKREIFIDGGDMTYRLRYRKKGDQLVYWVRIQETFNRDLDHYLRWQLQTDLTPRLLTALDQSNPGLADRVFAGLKPCEQCFGENCMDRSPVEWRGQRKIACKGSGWNQIGFDRADYENLWTVLETFDRVL